jgi:DNA-binding response OmpR family regulator
MANSEGEHPKNIAQILEQERFQVVWIKNLKELRLNFQIKEPDYVFLEYGFAGKSGEESIKIVVEYLNRVKEESGEKIPIVVYSYLEF